MFSWFLLGIFCNLSGKTHEKGVIWYQFFCTKYFKFTLLSWPYFSKFFKNIMSICDYTHDFFLLFWQYLDIIWEKTSWHYGNFGTFFEKYRYLLYPTIMVIFSEKLYKNNKHIMVLKWFYYTFFDVFVKNNHENGVISILFSKTISIKSTL